jgi:NAD(P)-dependent dehydrogenase (short-subunit alcohol dehydrogenase family)
MAQISHHTFIVFLLLYFQILGRFADPREIGMACLFLAADATFTTGEDLSCTAGIERGYGIKMK